MALLRIALPNVAAAVLLAASLTAGLAATTPARDRAAVRTTDAAAQLERRLPPGPLHIEVREKLELPPVDEAGSLRTSARERWSAGALDERASTTAAPAAEVAAPVTAPAAPATEARPVAAAPAAPVIVHRLAVAHRDQMAEPSPEYWAGETTPYCVPASLAMILALKGVVLPQPTLRTLFETGRAANVTDDPGIDPAGLQALMRRFGGAGVVHQSASAAEALAGIAAALDRQEPVVAFTRAGDHAVVVHGYERSGDALSAVWVSDPLFGAPLRVSAPSFMGDWLWYGSAFRAAGPQWQGSFVFATYR